VAEAAGTPELAPGEMDADEFVLGCVTEFKAEKALLADARADSHRCPKQRL
jgi:hypothetical protein